MEKIALVEVGLSEGEANILLALLGIGKCSIMQLAKETGRHRTHIYDTIEKLLEKGLVSFVIEDNKKFFQATDPANLLNYLKDREDRVVEILPELKKLYEAQKKDFEINILKGNNGLKAVLRDILREREDFSVYGSGPRFKDLLPDFYERWRKQSAKTIKNVRLITRRRFEVPKRKGFQHRFFPEEFVSPSSTFIYGNKVAIIFWHVPVAILIKDKQIVSDYSKYFEFLWEMAKK